MLRNKTLLVVAVALMVFSGLVVAEDLTIQGSSTVLPIAQRAAELYMQDNSDVNITVRGGGSGNGIAALIDDATDIADASRFIKMSEVENAVAKGIYPVPHRVAKDSIAVVVNPKNPVSELTFEQIKGIYTAEITNWKEVGGNDEEIVVVSRDSSSGTFVVFNDIVYDGSLDGEELRVANTALLQKSNGDVAGTVMSTPGAIGYVGLAYLEGLKDVKVEGYGPTSSKYGIARPLYMFTNAWPTGLAKDFLDFVLSTEGQKIVSEVGYVPLY